MKKDTTLFTIKRRLLLLLLILPLLSIALRAQGNTQYLWTDVSASSIVPKGERVIIPRVFRAIQLNLDAMKLELKRAPLEFTPQAKTGKITVSLPMPDGGYQSFSVVESPIMERGLEEKYPELKTYLGQGIDDPHATVRFDVTLQGFHAMIRGSRGTVFIDPYSKGEKTNYISYYKKDYFGKYGLKEEFRCEAQAEAPSDIEIAELMARLPKSSGMELRRYRLAVAATGEYTIFHGGTKPLALSAIVTTMNRVNGIYETETAIRMILIANNDQIIYTDTADPYTNGNAGIMINQNQTNVTSVIGSSNYDIGHVFGTNSGGLAGIGVVCNTSNKARGVTGGRSPVGDPFDVDYVAHEMGHQFSAPHTFNGTVANCGGGNRSAENAHEPGSGSTIMGYAGICGSDDLQPNSDAYFHINSILYIVAYSSVGNGNSCAVTSATGNLPPDVYIGMRGYTIPYNTPFYLTGQATDANNDPLTYCWEEYDLGPAGAPNSPSGTAPIFRSFNPVSSPARTFPKISDIVNNIQSYGELLPSYSRTMKFRLTARDNRAGGGGIGWDSIYFNVTNTAGPFRVTAPNTATQWAGNSTQTVSWDVNNTNIAPVSCNYVRILLSTDGGYTYPTVLSDLTPNDGSENISVPNISTSQARIRVEANGNRFFDISNTNFTIAAENPVPSVISMSTTTAVAGTSPFSLTVFGSNFVSGSIVQWNGGNRTTRYISATELNADLLASDLETAGYFPVTVYNPPPVGGTSGSLQFTVTNPTPALTSLSPSSAPAGGFGFTLTVNGSDFVQGTVVRWNGFNRTTTYVSPTRVDAAISASDIEFGGTANVWVYSAGPGGGTSNLLVFTINNPAPSAVSTSPSAIIAGGDGFTLTVYGVDFVQGAVVKWNGSDRVTTFVSATQVDAAITQADRATAGTATITVSNPAPGGGLSNDITININNPVPSISELSPDSVIAGGDGFTMTITGQYFVSGSVVRYNGESRATTYISPTQLEAAITASDRASARTANITVFNGTPGGGTSNAGVFTVMNPVPYLISLEPSSVIAGGDAFTLTVNGSNFIAGAVVKWNGNDRVTTRISSTQLEAAITAQDRAYGGTALVTVSNLAPGGGASNQLTFTVNNPTPYISTISPTSVITGGSQFQLTVNGSNFVNTSVVRVNGENRTTTYVSATQLEATITAADRDTGGYAGITVFSPTPGGGTSNERTLTINNPEPFISSISPANRTAGAPEFTLTINGSNFVAGSVVTWNGADRSTTVVSNSVLTATIFAEDVDTAGTALVNVFNPVPGGGSSLQATFTIRQGPAVQASHILVTDISSGAFTVNWQDGDGQQRAVFIKPGGAGLAEPVNDSTYEANPLFGSGSQIGTTGWFCVFNGAIHPFGVTVSGLTQGRYSIMICEYNGTYGSETYQLSAGANNPGTALALSPMSIPGNALDFDGTDDFVHCGNASGVRITGTQLTLEAWINARTWKTNVSDGSILVKEGTNAGYMLRCGDNGKVNFAVGNGAAWQEATTTAALTAGRWYHIAAVYNGDTMKIYVDGVEAASQAAAVSIANTANELRLGSSAANPSRLFDGMIDEVRVWNAALTQSDILASMNTYLSGNEAWLSAYYRFDQGTAGGDNNGIDILYDLTQNANDGTLSNFALNGSTSNWVLSTIGAPIDVNFKLFIEGLFNPSTNVNEFADTIKVLLRSAETGYAVVDSAYAILGTSGSASVTFSSAPTGAYYLVIQHRNSIETWSKAGGENLARGSVANYNFSTDASQAFGNNLVQKGSKWCIFSGDVNQDGIVDYSDLSAIDNDSFNFTSGYVVTDLSGDQFVDYTDLTIADNNNFNFVSVQSPLTQLKKELRIKN